MDPDESTTAAGVDHPALPPALRAPFAAVAVLAAGVTVVFGVQLSGHSTGTWLDLRMLEVLDRSVQAPLGKSLGWTVGTAGDPPAAASLICLLAAVCWLSGRRRLATLTLLGPVAVGVITTLLKPLVGRTIHGGSLSFPSGHTAQLTGMAIIVGLLLVDVLGTRTMASALLVLTCAMLAGVAMSWTQIANDVHYATDTIAGFCVALAVIPMMAWFIDDVADRLRVTRSPRRDSAAL